MGLDQYLTAKRYYSDASWREQEPGGKDFNQLLEVVDGKKIVDPTSSFRYMNVSIDVGQWRKANHIHAWFVDNVQSGEDNCGTYDVSREDLEQLLKLCKEVLKDPTKAADLLPRREGFFFGSEEYDEYYFGDIEHTVDIIERVLKECEGHTWSFQYSSSW